MRSRYTAYVLRRRDYLERTWHASTRPTDLSLDEPVKWLELTVLHSEAGGCDDIEGLVEFVARYKVQGRAGCLHEVSRFVREQGRWFYVQGDMQDARR